MIRLHDDGLPRCGWCTNDTEYRRYHDEEWGVPVYDDRRLFGMLQLEGAQAGLSWLTVLKKRRRYEQAFRGFDLEYCARMTDRQLDALLKDPGIVRNRLKVFGVRKNARAALHLIEREGALSPWLWSFVDGMPIIGRPATDRDLRATSPQSGEMSRALGKTGFTFVGSTICYAFMQATGMVDDHAAGCFRADSAKTHPARADARGASKNHPCLKDQAAGPVMRADTRRSRRSS